jgi:hypothetical protein
MMPKFLIVWLATGASLDLLFLCECYMMQTGMAGKVLQANFSRETRLPGKRAAIIATCIYGLAFPPYVLAGLIYFARRVRQERSRLREYGRG